MLLNVIKENFSLPAYHIIETITKRERITIAFFPSQNKGREFLLIFFPENVSPVKGIVGFEELLSRIVDLHPFCWRSSNLINWRVIFLYSPFLFLRTISLFVGFSLALMFNVAFIITVMMIMV